jgi:hypothetical protein
MLVPHTRTQQTHSKHKLTVSLLSSHLARHLHPGRVRSKAVLGEAKIKVARYWGNGEGADGGEEWGTGVDTWQSGGVACAQLPH